MNVVTRIKSALICVHTPLRVVCVSRNYLLAALAASASASIFERKIMKILITGGGCREYIDSVRVVTNSSSGRTSAAISDILAEKNSVTLVTAKSAIKAGDSSVKIVTFETGEELFLAIKNELTQNRYDAVLHAAAVSDFVPETITVAGKTVKAGKNAKKLPSGGEMTVTFRASPKIADRLCEWAAAGGNEKAKIVCFKLLSKANESERASAIEKLFSHSGADFVVFNDLSEITSEKHPFEIFNKNGDCVCKGGTNKELGEKLDKILNQTQINADAHR